MLPLKLYRFKYVRSSLKFFSTWVALPSHGLKFANMLYASFWVIRFYLGCERGC